MNKKLRFGIIGCGLIADTHARALRELERTEAVGCADNDPARAEAFAAAYDMKAYPTAAALLADESIDAVCICTPSCFHEEGAVAALQKGKHVVLEKPMAMDCASADRIIAACEESGKLLTVIFQQRFSDDVAEVRQLLAENTLGRISLCSLSMKYYRNAEYFSSSSWRGRLAFEGGGALMNQGIHGIDLMEYVVGPVQSVQGKVRTLCHSVEVEDTAAAVLTFENGALGIIEASTCAFPGFERKLSIHGDRGYVILRDDTVEELFIDGEMRRQNLPDPNAFKASGSPAVPDCTRHLRQLNNFVDAIEGKAPLIVDGKEGKKAVRIITEIYRTSAETCSR